MLSPQRETVEILLNLPSLRFLLLFLFRQLSPCSSSFNPPMANGGFINAASGDDQKQFAARSEQRAASSERSEEAAAGDRSNRFSRNDCACHAPMPPCQPHLPHDALETAPLRAKKRAASPTKKYKVYIYVFPAGINHVGSEEGRSGNLKPEIWIALRD